MKRADATRAGAKKLMETEAAIDNALRHAAELAGLLPTLRLDANLSAVVGQKALEEVGETFSHILAARRTIVQAHDSLDQVRTNLGCRSVAVGVMDKTADGDRPRTTGVLHVVGENARVA